MPQASEELRRKWDGPMEDKAMAFLKKSGFVLTKDWKWKPSTKNHALTEDEYSAILFLMEEWDFDGVDRS